MPESNQLDSAPDPTDLLDRRHRCNFYCCPVCHTSLLARNPDCKDPTHRLDPEYDYIPNTTDTERGT